MKHPKWHEMEPGAINRDNGNSINNFTGSMRAGKKPVFNSDQCINCFFCWVFCPENAIMIESDKIIDINYDFCKGCGICVNECPVKNGDKPLTMAEEVVEL